MTKYNYVFFYSEGPPNDKGLALGACKDKLIVNTTDAVNRGAFGVPTFFYDDQIFFGKDHLHQLEEYINSKG